MASLLIYKKETQQIPFSEFSTKATAFVSTPRGLTETRLGTVDPYNAAAESLRCGDNKWHQQVSIFASPLVYMIISPPASSDHICPGRWILQLHLNHSCVDSMMRFQGYRCIFTFGIHGKENKMKAHTVSFASSMASASVLNVLTQRTGPKISSLHICIDVDTLLMMAGSRKYPFFKCCNSTSSNGTFFTAFQRQRQQRRQVLYS